MPARRAFCRISANLLSADLLSADALASGAACAIAGRAVGAGTSLSANAVLVYLTGITTLLSLAALTAARSKRNSHYGGENQSNLFHFSTLFIL